VLHDARLKGGLSTTHPLRGDEIRAIKAWLVERTRMKAPERTFFLSEQRKPLHRSTVNLLLHKYGEKAKLPVAVHPHMLRHACGFALADQGAATLKALRKWIKPTQDCIRGYIFTVAKVLTSC
jgi:type 1 fimbriae regulatory protein FimB